jgi:drug/metabolite transporter (DMT)-like permease
MNNLYAILAVFLGVLLYGAQNVVIEIRLKQYDPIILLFWMYVPGIIVATGAVLLSTFGGVGGLAPTGVDRNLAMTIGIFYLVADALLLISYNSFGGNSMMATSVLMTMPLAVSVMRAMWMGEYPTGSQLLAFAFVAVGMAIFGVGGNSHGK